MSDYEIIGRGGVTVHWQPDSPAYTNEQWAEIERLWAARPPHVFNGQLLVYVRHETRTDGLHLYGRLTEYRFYYVQRRGGLDLGLIPVGVSGMMLADGCAVIARRSPHVTAYPNTFELVPSGGLDESATRPDGTIDYEGLIREEYQEETTLPPDSISHVQTLGVFYDRPSRIYDVACALTVTASREAVMAGIAAGGDYSEPTFIRPDEVETWLTRSDTLPTSRGLLALWRENTATPDNFSVV